MAIKKLILLAALCTSLIATSKEIEVFKIGVSDQTGAPVEQFAAMLTEQSVLLLVDTKQIASLTLLSKLQRAKLDWRNKLIVVVSGTNKDLKTAMSSHPLTGVKWLSTPVGLAPAAFKVGGAPFAIGTYPGGSTAWKIVGESAIADNDLSKLKAWLSVSTSPP
jgi:hypothetical protein